MYINNYINIIIYYDCNNIANISYENIIIATACRIAEHRTVDTTDLASSSSSSSSLSKPPDFFSSFSFFPAEL